MKTVTLIGNRENAWQIPVKVGDQVCLKKEPDNDYDSEAIKVVLNGKDIGYVANSTNTVIHGTISAGRLYDQIGNCKKVIIRYKTHDGKAIAEEIGC